MVREGHIYESEAVQRKITLGEFGERDGMKGGVKRLPAWDKSSDV